jgi:hypothetical protein
MASVEFRCPACEQRLVADGRHLRVAVACQRCGHELRPIDAIDHATPIPALPVTGTEEPTNVVPPDPSAAAGTPGAPWLVEPRLGWKTTRQGTVLLVPSESTVAAEPDAWLQAVAKPEPPPKLAPPPTAAEAGPPPTTPTPRRGALPPLAALLDQAVQPPPNDQPRSLPAQPLPSARLVPEPDLPPIAPTSDGPPTSDGRSRRLPTLVSPRPRRRHQTSLLELSQVAERTLTATKRRMPVNVVMAIVASITPQLVLAMVLTRGAVRWGLGAVTFLAVGALLGWAGLRLLPRLAKRHAALVLPGGAWIWLGGGAGALAVLAGLLTWGMSKGAAPLAAAAGLHTPQVSLPATATASAAPTRTDQKLSRTGHLQVGPGVLHVPATFQSTDGSFDLYLHFHGNPQLVEKSVAVAGLDAVVHVTNLGSASDPYEQHFVVPGAFDDLVTRIERKLGKLGLDSAKVRRIAVGSWSAGYGAVYRILQAKGAIGRIDALLMLDGLHVGYDDAKAGTADPLLLEPYLKYAQEAASGRKLFIITHSEIKPGAYASSTQTADLILGALGAQRQPLDPEKDSPPRVAFEEAVKAFPHDAQRWLQARNAAHVGNLHIYGYAGTTAEDHMAHLIQMSVTALPPLVQRWRAAPGEE